MSELIGTGVEYPTVELGGKTYEIKFTRALIYRLDKAGINFAPTMTRQGAVTHTACAFGTIIDTLKMAISFDGTAEDLAELAFDKRDEILDALVAGLGKVVLPSLQARAAARAANRLMAEQPIGDKPM